LFFRLTDLLNSTNSDDKNSINEVRLAYDGFLRLVRVSSIYFCAVGKVVQQSDYNSIEHVRVTAAKVVLRANEAGRPSQTAVPGSGPCNHYPLPHSGH
jgi:hypothetical protein